MRKSHRAVDSIYFFRRGTNYKMRFHNQDIHSDPISIIFGSSELEFCSPCMPLCPA